MSTQKTLLGALAGLAAGAALGLLLAPRSGKETRKIIRKKGHDAKAELDNLMNEGLEKWSAMKDKVVDKANMTKEDIQDFLKYMGKEGSNLKDRVMDDTKSTASDVAANAKRTADKVSHN